MDHHLESGDLNVMSGHWWMNVVKDSVDIQILDGIGRTDGPWKPAEEEALATHKCGVPVKS